MDAYAMATPIGHPTIVPCGGPSVCSITNTRPVEGIHVSLTKWKNQRKWYMLIFSEDAGHCTTYVFMHI